MTKPRIVVAPHFRRIDEIFTPAAWDRLAGEFDLVWARDDPMPARDFASAIASAEAVVFVQWPQGVTVPDSARLRVMIDVCGTLDHPNLDYRACFANNIRVGTIAPVFAPAVAEHSLGLALAAGRGISLSDRRFRTGDEAYEHAGTVGCSSLFDRTVGFVGCGALSRALQPLLVPFRAACIGYDPWLADEDFEARGIRRVAALEDLFDECSLIFVLAVPTESNRGLVSRALMERLDPDDLLVVTSRAHLVEFDALSELVSAGRFRAGVDVFPNEPLPGGHPIRQADYAVLTAHIAGALAGVLQGIGDAVLADLRAILIDGQEPGLLQYASPNFIRGLRRDTA